MYETILSPVDYGGLRLKNRILFAPTTFGLSDEETLAKYRALAEGGCAMIIVGDVPVGKAGLRSRSSMPRALPFISSSQRSPTPQTASSAPSSTRATPTCWRCSSTFPPS